MADAWCYVYIPLQDKFLRRMTSELRKLLYRDLVAIKVQSEHKGLQCGDHCLIRNCADESYWLPVLNVLRHPLHIRDNQVRIKDSDLLNILRSTIVRLIGFSDPACFIDHNFGHMYSRCCPCLHCQTLGSKGRKILDLTRTNVRPVEVVADFERMLDGHVAKVPYRGTYIERCAVRKRCLLRQN